MLLQVNTVKYCIKLFFCVYLWAGHQAAAESQLIYHNIGEKIIIKRGFCQRVSSMTYLLSSFLFFFLTSPQSSSHPASVCWSVSSLSVTNACARSAPAPAVFPRAWPRSPFLHPHEVTLGYGFSNDRCRSRWQQRRGSRVWTWGGFWVSCSRAADWRTLQGRKERVSVEHVTTWQPACTSVYNNSN